jgi:hypothetical protein
MTLFVIQNSKFDIRSSLLVLAVWLGFILVAQVQFIQTTTGADQGRYLFPAISVCALFFALGLTALVQKAVAILNFEFRIPNSGFVISSFVVVAFFLLALFVPFAYTLPAYARPPLLSENDLARVQHPSQVNFANQLELRGYDLDTRSVKQGDTLRVTLYWRARTPMGESYRAFVHLIGQDDRSAGGADVIPARGAFPTVYWKPGDMLRDVVQVPVAANAVPGKYALEVGLYPVGKPGERLTVVESGDDRVIVDAVKVAPRQAVAFNPRTRVGANFADKIELIGYDAATNPNTIQLTLYWRARAAMDRDYTVFVHALDASGKIVAQVDQQPQNGNYPTSLWDVNEQIRDAYTLSLPANARAADYRIALGMYRADTGERLPVRVGAAESDHLELNLAGAAP